MITNNEQYPDNIVEISALEEEFRNKTFEDEDNSKTSSVITSLGLEDTDDEDEFEDTDDKMDNPCFFDFDGLSGNYRILKLIDLDQLFANSTNAQVINNITMSPNLVTELTSKIYSDSEAELGFTATCACENLRGNYYEGQICPICHTKVSQAFANVLSHISWIGIPEELPPVLHPIVYMILCNWINSRSNNETDLLNTILNPEKELPDSVSDVIEEQGYDYFYKNFDKIMAFFLNSHPRTSSKNVVPFIKIFLETHRDILFTRKLPILHSSLHPIGRSGNMKYVDKSSKHLIKAVADMTCATFIAKKKIRDRIYLNKALFNVYMETIEYYNQIIKKKLGSKHGIIRQHCLGSRLHWTCRSVIIPSATSVLADELLLPWKMGVTHFRLEIINFLIHRYNISFENAIERQAIAVVNYDPLIDTILQTLIKECPFKGIPMLFGRNPVLTHGSIQLLYGIKFKTDVEDETINVHPLIRKRPNFDFDGDQLFALVLKEMEMVKEFSIMHPRETMFNSDHPSIGDDVSLTKQAITMLNNWYEDI